jgi:dTDP-4-amino-4,6-dideoxygalactose transaminase
LFNIFFKIKKKKIKYIVYDKLQKFFNAKNIFTISSWRAGLFVCLKSLNLEKDSEILVTPISIPDQINSIILAGCKPVFVDMNKETHNFDIEDLKRKINDKTKVIHITYLSGIIPDLDEILEIAKKKNLKIIEDISQAYGAMYKNYHIGKIGTFSIGSLSTGKTLASLAGGIIIINDDKYLNNIIFEMKDFQKKPKKNLEIKLSIWQLTISLATSKIIFNILTYYYLKILSIFFKNKFNDPELKNKIYNKKLVKNTFYSNPEILRTKFPSELYFDLSSNQLEILGQTLDDLDRNISNMRLQAKLYCENLNENFSKFIPRASFKVDTNTYWHFPLTFNTREETENFRYAMFNAGFDCVGYGLPLCNEIKAFNKFAKKLPNSKSIKENSIFLPLNGKLEKKDIEITIKKINKLKI